MEKQRRTSRTRERVLREVESRGSASTADIAAATGLHENTVREHLDRLRNDGRLRRIRAQAQGRGRPGWRWEAPRPDIVNPYAGLALALADSLDRVADDPVAQARDSGIRWGAQIAEDRPDAEEDTRALVVDLMREQGFAPEEEGPDIVLRRCPLLAAAARRTDVVCAVHEGMIAGIVGSRAGHTDAALLPLRADGGCLLHLRVAS
ncbi:helix-turn-helix transcriptional regulator [Microbacterium sp.]|uniref:helix-turn-helix transcriptional regulator n=1 Tax=Microbacterium sp. TaxID=51671 RepID=UPI003C787658